MRQLRTDAGSAVLEFVVFILLGQLLVFGGSMSLAAELSSKVELQLLASQTARTIAQGRDMNLSTEITLVRPSCPDRLICVTLRRGNLSVSAVSYQ